jgi:putative phage-type endonuclease
MKWRPWQQLYAEAKMESNMTRDNWLAERRTGIGASECAAVLGLDPYRGPVDVYNEKIGLAEPRQENEAMTWGKRLEQPIAEAFGEKHPEYRVVKLPECQIIRHPKLSFILCTPDRWLDPTPGMGEQNGMGAGLQIKTAGSFAAGAWREDIPPEKYLCQCVHEMACHPARSLWFLALLVGGQAMREYPPIPRDSDLEREILRRLAEFWENNVIARVPPPMDSTAASGRLLKALYPQAATQFVRHATDSEANLLYELKSYRNTRKIAEEFELATINKIKDRIATDKGLEAGGIRVLWSSVNGCKTIDYKAACAEANIPAELIEKHTMQGAPSRRFTVRIEGEDDNE